MRTAWLVGSFTLSLFACVESNAVQCGEVTCPAGTHCGGANECIPDTCGNNQLDVLEECDGNDSIDQATLRCTDYGFYKGPALTCTETCAVDTSQCSETCGDFTINGTERCDGIPPTGFACSDFGFEVGTIGCTDSCTPAFDFCSNIGWQLVPGGASDELYAIYLAAPDAGVAVGRAGTIIAAKDGVWLPFSQTVTTDDLNGVFGKAPNDIIAVGNSGTIVRYDGITVTKMTAPTTDHLRGISGGVFGAIAVGDNGTILRFDGTSWTKMTSPVSDHLYAVHVVGPTKAYAVGANSTVLEMQGTAWSKLTLSGLPAVTLYSVFAVDTALFVGGSSTTLARIVGNTALVATKPFDIPTDMDVRALWASSPSDLYAAGGNGFVMHWNGSYLSPQDTSTNRTIRGLDGKAGRIVGVTHGGSVIAFNGTSRHVQQPGGLTARELYAVYTDGTRTVAAGRDLVRLMPDGSWNVTPDIGAIAMMRSVFAIGTDVYTGSPTNTPMGTPGLYRSASGGTLTNVSASGVNAIWATASPLRIVTVGDKIIESTDGTTFPQTSTTTLHGANIMRGVWASSDGVWYAVGDGGTALRRAPAGVWTAIPTGTTANLLAVWGTASDDVFAVGQRGTILRWNGTAWRSMYSGVAENLVSISGNTGSDVFVTGTSFTRLHYDGIGWSRMASYGLDSPSVATYRGTTFYVAGVKFERNDRVISPMETRCGDPFDNDADNATNCDDPDCANDPQCLRGGACETLERVTCETNAASAGALVTSTYSGIARITDLPCLDHSSPGPEASYRFVAMQSGPVTVTIEDATHKLDLVVAEAQAAHCELQTCQPATASGDMQSVTFTATAGRMYYIVVDGPVGTAAPFTLSVHCD